MKIKNYDNPLVQAYYEKVIPSLVFVTCTNEATGQSWSGTATVFAHAGSIQDGFIPYLATAGHVLPDSNVACHFRLTRFSFDDLANPTSRTAEFFLPSGTASSSTPAYIRLSDKDDRDRIDIGVIRGPIRCTDGEPWYRGLELLIRPTNQCQSLVHPSGRRRAPRWLGRVFLESPCRLLSGSSHATTEEWFRRS